MLNHITLIFIDEGVHAAIYAIVNPGKLYAECVHIATVTVCNRFPNYNDYVFTFFYINRRNNWFCENFRFSVFGGFTRFGIS